jgi:squalene-hopene/tetraprenyl-beta-curcumene cyclase
MSTPPATSATTDTSVVTATLRRARSYLVDLQSEDGWWKGDLETNVTMDAEDLMMREFIGLRDPEDTAAAARWIRSQQREDGTWANFYDGPGDLSTSVEAYVALRIAGDAPEAPHMQAAAAFILAKGGVEEARVFTKIWLALFGLWEWDDLPVIPPEIIFLPPKVPLNIYEFGCWARQTFVALTVVAALRPGHPIGFALPELRTGIRPPEPKLSIWNWSGRFAIANKLLLKYEHLAQSGLIRNTVRELALGLTERWIVKRQEADGSWGGIQPPWVYSIMALYLRGYPLEHPVIAKALEGFDRFMVRENEMRWLEACQSPVWDTALATIALADAGLQADDPVLVRASNWLLGQEVTVRGDWSVRKPDLPVGGWAFEFANDNYPDVDDTAEVVLALRRARPGDQRAVDAAVARAMVWVKGMVSQRGAWGAFDADNIRELLYELPFSDFGAVIDPPSADVTAHVVEMLAHEGEAESELVQRAIGWLRSEQEEDGAWFGRWGVNYVYGVGSVIPALISAGVSGEDPVVARGLDFLRRHQNEDGGWGEDIRSYDDPSLRGQGHSTASQTAWALLAFVAAGRADESAAHRGAQFLASTQLESGGWDEPYYTGTGFPGDFYINYHLYRLVFPVSALGRWCSALGIDLGTGTPANSLVQQEPTPSR